MKQNTSGANHVAEGMLVDRYRVMLEPLKMYVENLKSMLYFQQNLFHKMSEIRCDYGGRRSKDKPCFHVACPLCWHRQTLAYLTKIVEAGTPRCLRVRTVEDVPPAADRVGLAHRLTEGETPWVLDARCYVHNTEAIRLSVLSIPTSIGEEGSVRDETVMYGDEELAVQVADFSSMSEALDDWFLEAPPPFTRPDYAEFVRQTKDFDFGLCIHAFQIPLVQASAGVDPQLLDL